MARTSKQSDDWAALLRDNIAKETKFPEGSLFFDEIKELFRARDLPCGNCSVRKWVRAQIEAGRLERVKGVMRVDRNLVQASKYLIKK